jgi:4-diphosphocytidyl-2-C-methyl-D-erythritol kinase
MKVATPAKINLYLKILGKRPDGYHDLETLMCPLDLADDLEITPDSNDKTIRLTIENSNLSTGPDNLITRAAQSFLNKSGIQSGLKIHLNKRIPIGGGLAGGSTNAASTLLTLNKIFDHPLKPEQLHEIAATLGSDINFFLDRSPAICTGRGEIVKPCSLPDLGYALLINPGFGVPTPWAYKTYATSDKIPHIGKPLWPDAPHHFQNDLENPVFTKFFWIAEAKRWLQQQPETYDSLMSGSGATVFALIHDSKDADKLLTRTRDYFGSDLWIQKTKLITQNKN